MDRFTKRPDDVDYYSFDFTTAFLDEGETIADFDLYGTGSLDVLGTADGYAAPAESVGIVTFWLTGGTLGEAENVICHATTNTGREVVSEMEFVIVPPEVPAA